MAHRTMWKEPVLPDQDLESKKMTPTLSWGYQQLLFYKESSICMAEAPELPHTPFGHHLDPGGKSSECY